MVQGLLGTRSRRGLAVLAAAVVLAGGTITTLAAWTEQERFEQQIGTTRLHLEANVAGTGWTSVDASPGGLTFKVPGLAGATSALLSPNVTASSFLQLRAAGGSQGATVNLNSSTLGSTAGSAAFPGLLTFGASGSNGVQPLLQSDCESGNVLSGATALVPLGTPISSSSISGSAITVPDAPSDGTPGTPVNVCLRVSMGTPSVGALTSSFNGASVTPIWVFSATSAH